MVYQEGSCRARSEQHTPYIRLYFKTRGGQPEAHVPQVAQVGFAYGMWQTGEEMGSTAENTAGIRKQSSR